MRLVVVSNLINKLPISIHAPLAGCDIRSNASANALRSFQSTHPLRGATVPLGRARGHDNYFNPRTPCGVRQVGEQAPQLFYRFQSTHPLRGATHPDSSSFSPYEFQSTHPLRGATSRSPPPRWGSGISIHAPLAGCDFRLTRLSDQRLNFNPRTPCGVRQVRLVDDCRRVLISIHAPLAGCDLIAGQKYVKLGDFNPRTPCGVRLPATP